MRKSTVVIFVVSVVFIIVGAAMLDLTSLLALALTLITLGVAGLAFGPIALDL